MGRGWGRGGGVPPHHAAVTRRVCTVRCRWFRSLGRAPRAAASRFSAASQFAAAATTRPRTGRQIRLNRAQRTEPGKRPHTKWGCEHSSGRRCARIKAQQAAQWCFALFPFVRSLVLCCVIPRAAARWVPGEGGRESRAKRRSQRAATGEAMQPATMAESQQRRTVRTRRWKHQAALDAPTRDETIGRQEEPGTALRRAHLPVLV